MAAVVAVGTQDGFVLLLDLGLDAPVRTDERAPGMLSYVTVLEPAVAQRRAEQAALGNHLCLPLNDASVEAGVFAHRTARGLLEHAQPAADTWVSAVQYVPQLRSLVVGLSFGCFQIWDLETLQMDFASRYEPGLLPVVSCVFLEPENDPRRFVYLWMLHSVPAYHDMSGSVASAALYALIYSERQWAQDVPVYRGLEQVGLKLVYDLTTTPEQPNPSGVLASCLLAAVALPAPAGDVSAGGGADDSLVSRDVTRCALAWEAWTADGSSTCTCLALFDLNRWYQAHMPHAVDAAALERCEYLRFFSLDVSQGIVLGVAVRELEPRSGLLSATLLLDVGVLPVTFVGPQERLLRCTLRALLDWLWRRAVDVVTQLDAACVRLFDLSGGPLAPDETEVLHALRAQLDGLGHVLHTMATRTVNTDVGLGELESKSYVLRVRSLHASVILWLCHAGLLPEQAEADDGGDPLEFAFPGSALAAWYGERRRKLGGRLLMVDGLVEELGEPLRQLWQEDGDGHYPPRSLHALTRAYLLDGVPDVRKHRLTHYLLMDLGRLLSDEHCDTLKSFPSTFAMSPSLIKLTHAFWNLDHGNIESALVFLMDPLVQSADLTAWQHRRIVESLLAQGEPRAALQYARARHLPAPQLADLRLHLRVLLDNGLVTEALKYEQRHRAIGGDRLVRWLLAGCQERRLLVQLMRLPLDASVERQFVDFLLESPEKDCGELLHVFYLQRGRYQDAIRLQRRLSAGVPAADPDRAGFRDSLHQLLPGLSILKVRRFLESSGGRSAAEETPSKQLRFGLLRGRRSLEESRASSDRGADDVTPPPRGLLPSLFTPGTTPAPPDVAWRPIPVPPLPTADAERSPLPEPASPPRKRQSLASELDDSEFFSFEASPTAAVPDMTLEFFDRERRLCLVERSWHDSDGEDERALTLGGDVLRRSRSEGDAT
ncbi:protein ELYS-like [Pollicipes pollicipes]|uniref:protein ELYS-like n=1 Tax=Pollicipes pollicipes TaxID=41117 RepID=UPI0018859496|nr:protein ELYS-like [Pollicipes pollicipes]